MSAWFLSSPIHCKENVGWHDAVTLNIIISTKFTRWQAYTYMKRSFRWNDTYQWHQNNLSYFINFPPNNVLMVYHDPTILVSATVSHHVLVMVWPKYFIIMVKSAVLSGHFIHYNMTYVLEKYLGTVILFKTFSMYLYCISMQGCVS